MRKFVRALLIACLFVSLAGAASAEVVGVLSRLNVSPEVFQTFLAGKLPDEVRSSVLRTKTSDVSCRFYDSLITMQMALLAGEIDSIYLPECVAENLLGANPKYEVRGFMLKNYWTGLSLGFREDSSSLRDRVDKALSAMARDGELGLLVRRHISGPEAKTQTPVAFEKFDDAETLKVAVTGDMPPIDYLAADGTPAGFNTAVLAELGRRLRLNIETVNMESGARAAALASKRVDCVFWFEVFLGNGPQWDIPDGILLSETYYGWNKDIFIGVEKNGK